MPNWLKIGKIHTLKVTTGLFDNHIDNHNRNYIKYLHPPTFFMVLEAKKVESFQGCYSVKIFTDGGNLGYIRLFRSEVEVCSG